MMKRNISLFFLIVVMIVIDQLVKWVILVNLTQNQVRKFIPGILHLTYLRNYGAAYSILKHQTWFFVVVAVCSIGGAIWYLLKNIHGSLWLLSGLSFVIAGGVGNLIDRLRQRFVVDMFQLAFIDFAIFNMADVYLTFGIIIILFLLFTGECCADTD